MQTLMFRRSFSTIGASTVGSIFQKPHDEVLHLLICYTRKEAKSTVWKENNKFIIIFYQFIIDRKWHKRKSKELASETGASLKKWN